MTSSSAQSFDRKTPNNRKSLISFSSLDNGQLFPLSRHWPSFLNCVTNTFLNCLEAFSREIKVYLYLDLVPMSLSGLLFAFSPNLHFDETSTFYLNLKNMGNSLPQFLQFSLVIKSKVARRTCNILASPLVKQFASSLLSCLDTSFQFQSQKKWTVCLCKALLKDC